MALSVDQACEIATLNQPNGSLASLLQKRHYDASLTVRGDSTRFRDALLGGEGVVVTAVGASNTVRGGCHPWQDKLKCREPHYNRNNAGWLLQVFDYMNRTWPHGKHKLVNSARMSTPPSYFFYNIKQVIPRDTTLLILAFNEICGMRRALNDSEVNALDGRDSNYVQQIIMYVRQWPRPPTILLWNQHVWFHTCTPDCRWGNGCERLYGPIGRFHMVPSISMHDALYHDALCEESPLFYKHWTIDNGFHLDLKEGDKIAAALVTNWMTDLTQIPRSGEAPRRKSRLSARGSRLGRGGKVQVDKLVTERTQVLSFSFDDGFVGVTEKVHSTMFSTPSLTKPTRCRFVEHANSSHGLVRKPGYVCRNPDECLRVNTTTFDAYAVRIGYVAGPRTHAVAAITCSGGCACGVHMESAYAEEHTLLREAEINGITVNKAVLPPQHCEIGICPKTTDEMFKFVSLTVIVNNGDELTNLNLPYTSRPYKLLAGKTIENILEDHGFLEYRDDFNTWGVDLADMCQIATRRGPSGGSIGIGEKLGKMKMKRSDKHSRPRASLGQIFANVCEGTDGHG